MSGRDVLRGPRGDSSTAISDGEAFSSHPRPSSWASIQVIHPDDKEKDREAFSEVVRSSTRPKKTPVEDTLRSDEGMSDLVCVTQLGAGGEL